MRSLEIKVLFFFLVFFDFSFVYIFAVIQNEIQFFGSLLEDSCLRGISGSLLTHNEGNAGSIPVFLLVLFNHAFVIEFI